jgi:hypothetical protein
MQELNAVAIQLGKLAVVLIPLALLLGIIKGIKNEIVEIIKKDV